MGECSFIGGGGLRTRNIRLHFGTDPNLEFQDQFSTFPSLRVGILDIKKRITVNVVYDFHKYFRRVGIGTYNNTLDFGGTMSVTVVICDKTAKLSPNVLHYGTSFSFSHTKHLGKIQAKSPETGDVKYTRVMKKSRRVAEFRWQMMAL